MTFNLSISEIIKAIKAVDFTEYNNKNINIKNIVTDSRKILPDSLFFGIKGEKVDGNDFAFTAIENGAAGVVTNKSSVKNLSLHQEIAVVNAVVIYIEDTVQALLDLSRYYKSQFPELDKTIAVTGSVGKTTTKEFIYAVISEKFKTHKTEGNLNTEIGLPMTLFALEEETEAVILEMGMSAFGEISRLSKTANPDTAVITNIGTSHIEKLGSREGIKKAKFEILDGMSNKGNIILNADEPLLYSEKGKTGKNEYFFGINNKSADFIAENIKFDYVNNASYFEVNNKRYKIPVVGIHNIYDALPAVITGTIYGLADVQIQNGFNNFKNAKMRQNIYEFHGITIIDDCYNASVESVTAALDVLCEVAKSKNGRKIAVLSDVLEAGDYSEEIHSKIGAATAEREIDMVLLYGEKSKITFDTIERLNKKCKRFYFTEKIKIREILCEEIKKDDTILFKASRGMALETVLEDFKNKF
ncbi:MAG: UDP-N-acetylmuramoyl-tripeptide--D-alanyl-D-alanine ligase [Oscillospiraceae bacterium]|nr:UDP-N-acetylmuramoyl-tripeptide--D-alanyl-D-alanine ligase [Oscillospiraceae bacterium]